MAKYQSAKLKKMEGRMKNPEGERPDLPYANSAAAIYITKQIDALREIKTQREIAREIGYDKPNILSMFKRGESKIPIDRVPAMARALHVDPGHLLRLVMEQHWEGLSATLSSVFGDPLSTNEKELIALWRKITENKDPIVTSYWVLALRRLLKN